MACITISSKTAAGTTTAMQGLASRLKIPSLNFTFKSIGRETGIPLADLQRLAQNDGGLLDAALDARQVAFILDHSARGSPCVLSSRLACFLDRPDVFSKIIKRAKAFSGSPATTDYKRKLYGLLSFDLAVIEKHGGNAPRIDVKFWLDVRQDERARRYQRRAAENGISLTAKEAAERLSLRDRQNDARYADARNGYGIRHAPGPDFTVIDATSLTPGQTVDRMLKVVVERCPELARA